MAAKRVAVITGRLERHRRGHRPAAGQDGCAIAILDMNRAGGEAVAKSLSGRFYECDVSDAKAVDAVAARIEKDLGPPTCSSPRRGSSPTRSPSWTWTWPRTTACGR